jgi:hypothetical protein
VWQGYQETKQTSEKIGDLQSLLPLLSPVKNFRPKKESETLNPKSDKSDFVWKMEF